MAGIGFELKKLFNRRGIVATVRAYGYAGIICTGPMLLGVVLILGIMLICQVTGTAANDRELLICMITYTLLASLLVTSFFSMVVTRFIADMIYQEHDETILPSFWGSSSVMLVVGGILYGIFLIFSGATLIQGLLCWWLFGELIVTWNGMSYLTAIKDYKGILFSFIAAILTTLLLGLLFIWIGIPHIEAMLLAVCIGYGVMLIWDCTLLCRFFPQGEGSPFLFLRWIDDFLPLAFTGLFLNLGLFGHLIIMWIGSLQVHVKGLFVGAPYYDVPALIAFLTILVTTINFVVSVEVNFYPRYREYYDLLNEKGSIKDINQAEQDMLKTLAHELKYTALKQLFTTAIAVALGGLLMQMLPLGFNDSMQGYFRVLCIGYGIYAVGNTVLLILLYFTDYKGALISSGVFAITSIGFSIISLVFSPRYFGFGFLVSTALFFIVAVLRLESFTRRLRYHILSVQPIVATEKHGIFFRIEEQLEERIKGDQS